MAYGFYASNANNEVVIDDTNMSLQVKSAGTVSGQTVQMGSYYINNAYPLGADRYSVLPFVRLPNVGDWVCACDGLLFSNRSSLYITRAAAVSDMSGVPVGQGYGMEVYDSSGNITFSSARDLVAVTGSFVITPDSTTVHQTTAKDFYIGFSTVIYESFSSASAFVDAYGIERVANGIRCFRTPLGDIIAGSKSPNDFLVLAALIV